MSYTRGGEVRPLPEPLRHAGGPLRVAADERFATVLNGITKERQHRKRQQYNAAYRARPRTDPEVVAARLARAAYMRDYRSRPRTEEEVQADRARKAAYMRGYRAAQ